MCGIAGLIARDGWTGPIERLTAMRDELRHCGPDDAGAWWSEDRRVGFAHRRLAIIDLSPGGHQPMANRRGDLHITFLVPTIVNQLKAGTAIRVKDLEPRRDYVYVLDVVEAMVQAIRPGSGFGVFNIGSGTSHSVAELIRTIQDVWGTNLPVHSEGVRRKDEIMDTVADTTRAGQQLGWAPRFTLHQGIEHLHLAQ